MRPIVLFLFCFSLAAAPLWAEPVSAPLLLKDRLYERALKTAQQLDLQLNGPPQLRLSFDPVPLKDSAQLAQGARRLSNGLVQPDLSAQLGPGGFEPKRLHLTLTLKGSLTPPAEKRLRQRLAEAMGPLAQGDWLTLTQNSTAPKPAPQTAEPPQTPPAATQAEAPQTMAFQPTEAPRSLEPLSEAPRQEPFLEPEPSHWIWVLAGGVLMTLILALMLRRRAESPSKDLERLRSIEVEGEVDFTDLKSFKGLFKETEELDLDQIKADLAELLKIQPEWARELAVDRGPRGLARLMAVFGPERSRAAFGEALETRRIDELLGEAEDLFFSPEEENKLLMELHQRFFLNKLKDLKDEKARTAAKPPTGPPPKVEHPKAEPRTPQKPQAPSGPPQASPGDEAAALEFLKDAEAEEVYRLIAEETPLIQALVLRHWPGDAQALALRLQHPASLADEQNKQRALSPELLAQIARGLRDRLETQREAAQVDPKALGEALEQLESLGPLEREEYLVRLEEKEPALGEAARQSFFPYEELPQLDPMALRRALSGMDPALLANALKSLSKPLQEPVLLALPRESRSALISGLRQAAPSAEEAQKARGLLAQSLTGLRRKD